MLQCQVMQHFSSQIIGTTAKRSTTRTMPGNFASRLGTARCRLRTTSSMTVQNLNLRIAFIKWTASLYWSIFIKKKFWPTCGAICIWKKTFSFLLTFSLSASEATIQARWSEGQAVGQHVKRRGHIVVMNQWPTVWVIFLLEMGTALLLRFAMLNTADHLLQKCFHIENDQ